MEREQKISDVLGLLARSDCVFVDLREPEEYRKGHLRGAWNIPYDRLMEQRRRLRGYRKVFLYCERGNVSLIACRELRKEGYPAENLWGGVHAFLEECRGGRKNNIDYYWEKN